MQSAARACTIRASRNGAAGLTAAGSGWYRRQVRPIWLSGLILGVLFAGAPGASPAADAPVQPLASTGGLTSGFGEFRSGHFHAGLDYSTDQVEGKEVRAVRSGWVERVRASGVGYGRAVYLRLDDGRTAVYGHLSRFAPKLDAWVAARQESAGVYEQDLMPAEGEIPFRRGEVVAWSGQSGAGPPHLHFELRAGDMNLNPLLHGFPLSDRTAPALAAARLEAGGVRGRSVALRQGGVARAGEVRGPFRLLVSTWDRADGRPNKLATYRLEAKLDGKAAFLAVIDSVSWDHAIEAERVYDYASTIAGATTWRPLELLPTYQSGITRQGPPVWALAPGPHRFDFEARDEAGNRTSAALEFTVLAPDSARAAPPDTTGARCGVDSLPCSLAVRSGGLEVTARFAAGSLYAPARVQGTGIAPGDASGLIALGGAVRIDPADLVLSSPMRLEGRDAAAAASTLAPRGVFLRQTRSWSLLAPVDARGTFTATSRRLGAVAVFADTTRPRVVPASSYRWRASAPEAAFSARIADSGSGLAAADQAMYLDERRVPAEYDPEAGRLTWRPRARPARGTHALRIEAVDRLGNRSVTTAKLEVE